MKRRLYIYDTTLRDGAQAEGVSFSVEDKLKILKCLDEFGIDYVEGGWPVSNPKDTAFFQRAQGLKLRHTRLTAFGSTRRKLRSVSTDPNLQGLLGAGTGVVTLFGKAWTLHVKEVLNTTTEENLKLILESVRYMSEAGKEVIFDAEHFYDGFREDPAYAVEVLSAAKEGGAKSLVLCDTNGGMIPRDFRRITGKVVEQFGDLVGVHVHNDSGVAVANSIEAVELGVSHVQGTFGGLGERSGNADLASIVPILILKMGHKLGVTRETLKNLTSVVRYVSNVANHHFPENTPFVGARAFAHKGGMHVDSMTKHARTYEHIAPESIGNDRRFLVSELSGKSNILQLARHEGIDLGTDEEVPQAVATSIKRMENQGYQFEGAEASAALIIRRILGDVPVVFELVGFRVIVERRAKDKAPISEATVKVRVDSKQELSVGEGNGPVDALDAALRSALVEFYPEVANVRLTDYRVRVIDEDSGSAAKVRVVIESTDEDGPWGTVGVSENIIEASWIALSDSIIYGLMRHGAADRFSGNGADSGQKESTSESSVDDKMG